MKPVEQLINREEPGWTLVQEWLAQASNPVEVLPAPDDATRNQALFETQVTTRSPMGAVVYESGGILVDSGWLRILGAGHPRLPRSLPGWNQGRSFQQAGEQLPFLLIGDDVAGGFFAIDGGGLGQAPGKVCYHAPDTLAWESTGRGYSDFLAWCFSGDLAKYYESFRWPEWREEIGALAGDQVLSIYPFLSCAGPAVAERSRRPCSIAEIYRLHIDAAA